MSPVHRKIGAFVAHGCEEHTEGTARFNGARVGGPPVDLMRTAFLHVKLSRRTPDFIASGTTLLPHPHVTMTSIRILALLFLAALAACAGDASHPWIVLPEGSAHRIVESTGIGDGQVVIAMDPAVTRDEAMQLGNLIQSQAPEGVTVNARLYNDEETARNWRTVDAQWTLQHLWVTVTVIPQTGRNEVRWVGPAASDSAAVAVPITPDSTTPPAN